MLGWMLLVLFLVYQLAGEGAVATATGLASALGVDAVAAVVIGTSVSEIFTGAGLADDVIMLAFSSQLRWIEKVALAVFLEESKHVAEEGYQWYDHTDYQNEQFARYLARHEPGQTFLFGDVTPRDLFDLGISGGVLLKERTFTTLLDAVKNKFGGLVTETAEFIEL